MTTKNKAGTRVSEYVLEECIGMGSFAEVWRARHHVWSEDRVAIKLPTEPEYVRYLRREGAVVHGLRHANVIRVLGMDPYAEIPYLVMELVKGPALREILDNSPTGLDVKTAGTIMTGILNGLFVAHGANVIHRDIKPGNVLLDLDGKPIDSITVEQVKLGDFGLGIGDADMLRSIAQSASMDRDNTLVGTLAYMAPELRDGGAKSDARSDLYSVGVVLFEVLTGERPAGVEMPSTLRPAVPPAFDEIFRRLYARYDRRYESAQAVLTDLEAALGALGARGAASPTVNPPPLPVRKSIEQHAALEFSLDAGGRSVPPLPRRSRAKCPHCNKGIESEDQFCTHCGAQLAEKIRRCENCESFPGPLDRYCIFCGETLTADVT